MSKISGSSSVKSVICCSSLERIRASISDHDPVTGRCTPVQPIFLDWHGPDGRHREVVKVTNMRAHNGSATSFVVEVRTLDGDKRRTARLDTHIPNGGGEVYQYDH